MRDLIIGYAFIFVSVIGFTVSIFVRGRRLRRRIQDLKEELNHNRER